MKKFLYPLPLLAALLCAFLLNCSNDGFEKPKPGDLASLANLDTLDTRLVKCVVDESKPCYEISKSACDIIGGKEIEPEERCVSFDCGWDLKEVEYGKKSSLSFKWNNQEDCSFEKISYGNKDFDNGTEYTISSSVIPGLSYSKDTSIVAKATVTCQDQVISHNCRALNVKSVPIEFTCKWTSDEVQYGKKNTLNFNYNSINMEGIAREEGCSLKISPSPLDTGEHTISSNTIKGLSYKRDTTIVAKAILTCGSDSIVQNCKPLKVDSVPGPEWTGKLSFKKSDYDTNNFFIGTKVDTSNIKSTIQITKNKEEAECGDIKIKIDGKINGSTTAKFDTPIKATAIIYCKYTDTLELASISATVLPNPVIGDCEFAGTSKATMRSIDTLKVSISVNNDYGRCKKPEYIFSGNTWTTTNSFPLASSGNTTLNNIRARVACDSSTTTVTKTRDCPSVAVTNYIKYDGCVTGRENREALTFKKGKTTVEFACNAPKDDYYIACQGNRFNFEVTIDGYKNGDKDTDIRPNNGDNGYNFPKIEPTRDGNLYRYPIPAIVNNTTNGDIKCGIW